MKVAITGGNGFLAGYCVDLFEMCNIVPVLIARKNGKYKNYKYCITDYTKDSLKKIFKNEKIDAIVHLAGPRKIYSQISMYCDYFDMTTAVYDAAFESGIYNLVFASSISVYSGDNLPSKEEEIPMPCNNYGLSKVVCEQIGNIYNRSRRMYIKNLRFAHLYGANETNMYMINKFFKEAYDHKQLFVDCKGFARREMLYTKDAALAIVCALREDKKFGTYNIGSGDALTNEEIAEQICRCMSPENRIVVGEGEEKIKSSYMYGYKAFQELGFCAKYNLKTALPEIYIAMKEANMRG